MPKSHTRAWLEPGAQWQRHTSFSLNTACGLTGQNTTTQCTQSQVSYCLQSPALTVGEVEAGSHVTFRVSRAKSSHYEEAVDQEAQPSHANCPHVSSEPPTNFAVVAFQVLGEFMKSLFCEAVLVFGGSLYAVLVSVLERRVFPLAESWGTPRVSAGQDAGVEGWPGNS